MASLDHQANRVLDRIELRFGVDRELRDRLHPVVKNVLSVGAEGEERKELLRLVAEAFAHQLRVRELIDDLKVKVRRRVNEKFAHLLGIQPPNLDPPSADP
jgi:hypothetical protein